MNGVITNFAQAAAIALEARKRGDRKSALEYYRAAAALAPDKIWILCEVGAELRELGRLDEAEAVLQSVISQSPDLAGGWRGLGLLARKRGDRKRAVECLQTAVERDPNDVWSLYDFATELRESGRLDEAEAALTALLERNPNSVEALLGLANVRRHRAAPDETLALFEKAHALSPSHRGATFALAGENLKQWRIEQAEALYDALLTTDEYDIAALIGRAQAARRRGDIAAVLDYYRRAASAPNATARIASDYSRELFDAGRIAEAEQVLNDALSRNPDDADCHLRAGYIARARGDHVAAREAFGRAAGLDPAAPLASIETAIEDFDLGRTTEAFVALEAILAQHPNNLQAISTLARFAEQIGDLEHAIDLRRKALEIDPSNWSLYPALADGLAKLGRSPEAQELVARGLTRVGAIPEMISLRIRLHMDRGEYGLAESVLEPARKQFPQRFDLWAQNVALLAMRGAFNDAWRATEDPPSANARERIRTERFRGEIAMAQWRPASANGHFAEALRLDASDRGLNDQAARAALLCGDVETARKRNEIAGMSNARQRVLGGGYRQPKHSVLGQIIEEYQMDRVSLARLRAALASSDPVSALASLVAETPDYTPAALHYLFALRRARLLDSLDEADRPGETVIPANIAQYWDDDDIPADVQALCEEWRAAHPTFSYSLFSKALARDFIRGAGLGSALAAFDRAREPARRASVFRLAWLFRQGGYYVDVDARSIAPLSTIAAGDRDLILHQLEWGPLGANFIAAAPGHPAIGLALKGGVEALNRGDADIAWLSTGPGLLTRAVAKYLAERPSEHLPRTLILAPHELGRAVALQTIVSFKHGRKHGALATFRRRQDEAIAQIAKIGEPDDRN